MGQTTSALWRELLHKPGTEREYKFDVAGTEYGKDAEVSHSVESQLFEEFGIGNACCATLKMALYADNVPRAAAIKRYLRLVNGTQATDWIPKGVFFTNRRSCDGDYWEIEAYDAMRKADPIITEPIMKVAVIVPDEYLGDVIGDLNARRGQIQGMEAMAGTQRVNAFVPLAQMFGYATDLRSKTQGRGQYVMEPSHYEPVPKNIADQIIAGRTKA